MSSGASFELLIAPRSVAVVGSISTTDRVGARTLRLLERAGYPGTVEAVSRPEELQGDVDVAVVAVPARHVQGTLDRLRGRAHYAVVYSSGFAETGGTTLREPPEGPRVLGPNTVGVYAAPTRTILSFARALESVTDCRGGSGAVLVSQSGAFGARLVTAARKRGLHLDGFVATGNEDGLALDEVIDGVVRSEALRPRVLLVYTEAVREPARLSLAVRRASREGVCVIVLLGGRSSVGTTAAASHTGALSADAAVLDEMLLAAGATVVRSDRELLDAAVGTAVAGRARGGRVGILTGSGGAGVVAADLAVAHELDVCRLSESTEQALAEILPDFAAVANPVDVTADAIADSTVIEQCVRTLAQSGEVDMLLTVGRKEHAKILSAVEPRLPAVLTLLDGDASDTGPIVSSGVAAFGDLAGAVTALTAVAKPLGPSDVPCAWGSSPPSAARERTDGPGGASRSLELVGAVGVEIAPWGLATTAAEAASVGWHVGWPVVLKADTAAGDHKARSGGVALDVTEDTVAPEASRMLEQFQALIVARQLPRSTEFLAGVRRDPVLGLVAVTGLGGGDTELIRRVVALPADLPQNWIAGRIARVVFGSTDPSPPQAARRLAVVVHQLARLAEDGGHDLVECNPLVQQDSGLVALDARVVTA